jgi:hypothetical protein
MKRLEPLEAWHSALARALTGLIDSLSGRPVALAKSRHNPGRRTF